jgi:hypothetical protein
MHRIIHTANSQYYLIDDQCVAVRSQAEPEWSKAHRAVGQKLIGSIKMQGAYEILLGKIALAGRLVFTNDLMTSPVRSIELAPQLA